MRPYIMKAKVLPALLSTFTLAARSRASVHSDITNGSQLLERLGLTSAELPSLSQGLSDADLDHALTLDSVDRSSTACLVADAVFGSKFIGQSSSVYEDSVEVNWSNTCWLEPQCIIQPESAQDVSKAVAILTFFDTKFAIRSGGHNPNPGFAGISEEGILIDMSQMTEVTLSKDGSVASLGPGNRFGEVAITLNSSGRAVHGGRNNQVGIGGYFLGGGLTYFNSIYGLGADQVANFEVVLANSSIINANADTNPDLWWALKGCGTNFGVVTRYDVRVTENSPYWFEGFYYAPEQIPALLEAVVEYANGAENDPNAEISFNLNPAQAFVVFIYAKPVIRPDIYNMFYNIPSSSQAINSTIGNMLDLNNAMAEITPERHERRLITSTVHQLTTDLLKEIYTEYVQFDSEVQSIGADTGVTVQPFTTAAVRHAATTGGNPIGLTEVLQDHMEYFIQWEDSANDEAALAAIQNLTTKVDALAKQKGLYLETKVMNDAAFFQNVLGSYGSENLQRLNDVASHYDPSGVFQTLQNNGFLLSKA
ncbi:hypothetical protein F4678DRAFT_434412 [Xylaria arbuscula]|nr:hypothetical protein F4678DRAFT_434412 [Xylaria arbuscula]